MRKLILTFVTAATLSIGGGAQAALVGHSTYLTDTDTGLDWLSLLATEGQTYNQVIGGFGGYIADGWTYASLAQVATLFDHAGATGPYNVDIAKPAYKAPAALLGSLLGFTTTFSVGGFSIGLVSDVPAVGSHMAALYQENTISGYLITPWPASGSSFPDNAALRSDIGSFLIRQTADIPEPSVLGIFGGVFTAWHLMRSRRRKA